MAKAHVDAADDLLDELVHQFSDPFAFYRELVQNSIDAGSSRIDIVLRYQPDRGGGTATAEISDWGEGMNRQVIEDYLLTKFRSSKENDLTKIGKFGIGFVSVFAPGPELVVVDTGRDGEFWRILFKEDRTYELFKHPEPVEGTRITLHKRMPAAGFDTFQRKSLEALRSWCRHSEAEVTFATGNSAGSEPGEPVTIGEPFVVNAPYQVEYAEEGTRIVAGPSRVEPPQGGLYNRGLTLLETTEPLVPGITFKLLSRYLEHTLTRDNVLRDEHFDRAMSLVRKLADGAVLERLPAELKMAAETERWDDYSVLLRFARDRRKDPHQLVFPSAHGGTITGAELERSCKRAGAVPCAEKGGPLVASLERQGVFALKADPRSALAELVAGLFRVESAAELSALFSTVEPQQDDARALALVKALEALLPEAGARSESAIVGRFLGAGFERAWVTVEEAGVPVTAEAAKKSPFLRGSGAVLCLNAAHPRIGDALQIAGTAPAVAAALVLRMISADGKPFGDSEDTQLTVAALRA